MVPAGKIYLVGGCVQFHLRYLNLLQNQCLSKSDLTHLNFVLRFWWCSPSHKLTWPYCQGRPCRHGARSCSRTLQRDGRVALCFGCFGLFILSIFEYCCVRWFTFQNQFIDYWCFCPSVSLYSPSIAKWVPSPSSSNGSISVPSCCCIWPCSGRPAPTPWYLERSIGFVSRSCNAGLPEGSGTT